MAGNRLGNVARTNDSKCLFHRMVLYWFVEEIRLDTAHRRRHRKGELRADYYDVASAVSRKLMLDSALSKAVSCTPGMLVPSTRITVTSVMPRKPSTVRR